MHHSITSLPQMERDQLTLSLLEQMTPYLRRAARSGKLDFDDLYQDASIKIMRILDHYRDQVRYLQAYVLMSMHNLVLDTVKRVNKRCAISLDEPLSMDVSLTLADLLPGPYSVEPVVIVLAQERLEELESSVVAAKHHGTRRMLREMHATALAGIAADDGFQLSGRGGGVI
jgi:DNA-directed RNA polymerase specialized sigma24 family protein